MRRDFGHPSFRFVSWTSGSWMPGVGSIGVIWWMTHFFSQCLTRPSRICACVRAASRWPRVDIVHSPSEVSKPRFSSPKKLARAFCYRGRKASRTTSEPARRGRGRNGAAERRRSRAGSKSPPCAPRWLPRWAPPAPRAPATGEGGAKGVRESSLTRSAADARWAPSPHRASRLTARRRARGDDADTVGRPLQSRRRRAPHHPARRRNLGGCRAIRRLGRRGRQHRRGHRDGARGARHGVRRGRRVARAHRRR